MLLAHGPELVPLDVSPYGVTTEKPHSTKQGSGAYTFPYAVRRTLISGRQ
jgi:hypothetical protein